MSKRDGWERKPAAVSTIIAASTPSPLADLSQAWDFAIWAGSPSDSVGDARPALALQALEVSDGVRAIPSRRTFGAADDIALGIDQHRGRQAESAEAAHQGDVGIPERAQAGGIVAFEEAGGIDLAAVHIHRQHGQAGHR